VAPGRRRNRASATSSRSSCSTKAAIPTKVRRSPRRAIGCGSTRSATGLTAGCSPAPRIGRGRVRDRLSPVRGEPLGTAIRRSPNDTAVEIPSGRSAPTTSIASWSTRIAWLELRRVLRPGSDAGDGHRSRTTRRTARAGSTWSRREPSRRGRQQRPAAQCTVRANHSAPCP
jgi:hypothetical protein